MSSGQDLGTILSMFFSPFIVSSFGWKSIFYVCGVLGILWYFFFYWIASSSPELNKHISIKGFCNFILFLVYSELLVFNNFFSILLKTISFYFKM